MCGRFTADREVFEEVEKLVGSLDGMELRTGDFCPSQEILILTGTGIPAGTAEGEDGEKRRFSPRKAVWGYPGRDRGRLLFNARTETVEERPTFRRDFARRRCAVAAGGFYEWNTGKEKFLFTGDGPVLYLAGIYAGEPGRERACILTVPAEGTVRPVHERMPLILSGEELEEWIRGRKGAECYWKRRQPDLKREKCGGEYGQLSLFDGGQDGLL